MRASTINVTWLWCHVTLLPWLLPHKIFHMTLYGATYSLTYSLSLKILSTTYMSYGAFRVWALTRKLTSAFDLSSQNCAADSTQYEEHCRQVWNFYTAFRSWDKSADSMDGWTDGWIECSTQCLREDLHSKACKTVSDNSTCKMFSFYLLLLLLTLPIDVSPGISNITKRASSWSDH